MTRMFATGLWLAVTLALTATVWTATSIVAADVTDRPAPVVAHHDVVSELELGTTATSTPTDTTPPAGGSPPTVPARPGPASVNPGAPAPTAPPPQVATPGPTIAASAPPTTPISVPAPSPPPTNPPVPPPSRPTTTYTTSGGAVRVACNGFFIELISAIPSNGYAVNVVAGGPGNVDVHFVGAGQDVSVKAVCVFGGPFRYYEQTPPAPAPGSS